jgi:hypothetical protein
MEQIRQAVLHFRTLSEAAFVDFTIEQPAGHEVGLETLLGSDPGGVTFTIGKRMPNGLRQNRVLAHLDG